MNYERANHKWDDARDARLTELWDSGALIGDIAVKMFTTVGAIADRRHDLGLPRRKEPSRGWTPEREALAKKLYIEEGKSAAHTASILGGGLTRNSIVGVAHRRGWMAKGRKAPAEPTTTRVRVPHVPRSHVRPPKPGPQNKPDVILGAYSTSTPEVRAQRAAEGRAANDAVAKGMGVSSPNARPWTEDRRLNECNWSIGERGAIKSCCNPVYARGWCRGHHALGTVPTIPMRPRAASSYARFDRVEKDRPVPAQPDRTEWDDARQNAA